MHIYLIRHGQTEWNDDDRYQGSIDVELSETGLEQASLIGERMKSCAIETIVSSDLKRARQTADIIKQQTGANLIINTSLREICLGDWEGKRWKDIKVEYSDFLKYWFTDMVNIPAPGGESYAALKDRSLKIFDEISKQRITSCAIVTHGAVVKVILSEFLGLSLENRSRFIISNASVSTLIYSESKGTYKIFNINDISHLENLRI